MLIGDFLVSNEQGPVGLSKKVHRLSPSLVIAYTGEVSAASQLFTALKDHWGGQTPDRTELEFVLTSFGRTALDPGRELRLIGWLAHEEPVCFSWNAIAPGAITYGDPRFGGSGQNVAKVFAGMGLQPAESETEGDLRIAVDRTLRITTELIRTEAFAAGNSRFRFGHAYEIVYFSGREFEYVSDILYAGVHVGFDAGGKFQTANLEGRFYHYRDVDDHVVLNIYDSTTHERIIDVIAPLGIPTPEFANELLNQHSGEDFPFASAFYCLFIRISSPRLNLRNVTFTLRGDDPPAQHIFKPEQNALGISLPVDLLEAMYDAILKDLTVGSSTA